MADELSCFFSEAVYITKPTVTTKAAACERTPLWVGKTECLTDFPFMNMIFVFCYVSLRQIFNIFFFAHKILMSFVLRWFRVYRIVWVVICLCGFCLRAGAFIPFAQVTSRANSHAYIVRVSYSQVRDKIPDVSRYFIMMRAQDMQMSYVHFKTLSLPT